MPLPSEELNPQATTIDISEVIYPTLAQVESMPKTQEVDIDKQLLAETVTRDTVYQICGYLLYTRRSLFKCLECLPTMQTKEELLPADFYYHCLTDIRSKGRLKYCTPNMFQFFHAVEVIYKEVNQGNLHFGINWFNRTMSKIGKKKLEVIFFLQ